MDDVNNIKGLLKSVYKNKDYDSYFRLFNEYLDHGYGVDFMMLYQYINALIFTRNYDQAYNLIKEYEKVASKYDIYDIIAQLYLFCFKPEDALRVFSLKTTPIYDYTLPVKIYLMLGKVDEAKELVDNYFENLPNTNNIDKMKYYKRRIDNYYKKGAFIETEYSSFLKNGNALETGHIVFLKNSPTSKGKIEEDVKKGKRPYMIWKIENDKIYLFPVSSSCDKGFRLYSQKYPNSIGDRIVKGTICETTFENILSVDDKVLDEDLRSVLKNLFSVIYYYRCKDDKQSNINFMRQYVGDIENYDIIEFVDPSSRKRDFYFVLDELESGYEVIECDFDNLKIIGKYPEIFKKERLVFKVRKLNSKDSSSLLAQVPQVFLYKSLKKKIVTSKGNKYIVVKEKDDKLACVSACCSASYINLTAIDRNTVDSIDGEVDSEELDYINKLLSESNGISIKTLLKQKKL